MIKIGNINFLEFPILLAPMEGISDFPFRYLCKKHGADLMYSEFISSEGLIRNNDKSFQKLYIHDNERPIGIQVFGGNTLALTSSIKIIESVNPDLIDINFGCPVKKIVKKGAGAAILKDVEKMIKVTKSIVKSTNIPVTVKTRIGWDANSINIDDVAEKLQDVGIRALTIHARTREQMYKGESDWSHILRVKNNNRIKIPIFGNGDINSVKKAFEFKNKYGVDGIMIGRAAIGYPWIFEEIKYFLKTNKFLDPPNLEEKIETLKEYLMLSIKWKGEKKAILGTRKQFNYYFRGIANFNVYKKKLMESNSFFELLKIFNLILNKN